MLKIILFPNLFLFFLLSGSNIWAQMTAVPDPFFEQILINKGIDSGSIDGQVPTINLQGITDFNLGQSGDVSDLTGIENMKDLIDLRCSGHKIVDLDLSGNLKLETLSCSDNLIEKLNVTKNFRMKKIWCGGNELEGLDVTQNFDLIHLDAQGNNLKSLNVIHNEFLENLFLSNNDLQELNVSNNTRLISLYCGDNFLDELDVSNNKMLEVLSCGDNSLSILDLSQNKELRSLSCDENDLSSLDLFLKNKLRVLSCCRNKISSLNLSHNKELETLYTCSNQLTQLDVSFLPLLRSFDSCDNDLVCLNVKNGKNMEFTYFDIRNNPFLPCIQVDDPAFSISNWTLVDADVSFNFFCGNTCTVGAEEVKAELSAKLYPNPSQSDVHIEFGENLVAGKWILYNLIGQQIKTQVFEKSNLLQLDLELASGVYFLKIEANTGESKAFKIWRL